MILPYTKELDTLNQLTEYHRICNEFRSLAKRLHKSFENDCNYGLTDKQQRNEDRMIARVHELAKSIGLYAYIQTDPRGGTLYLDDKPIPENNYTHARFIT